MSEAQAKCIGKGSEKGECTELLTIKAAARTVLEGFDKHVFVRDTSKDDRGDWAIRCFPYLRALSVLQEETRR